MKPNTQAQNQTRRNQEAVAFLQAGHLSEAEAICAKILRNTPQQPETLNILSAIRASQGNIGEAVKLLNRALAYAPEFLDAYTNRSNYLQQLGRYTDAIADCDRALALSPNLVAAWVSKASALIALRQFTDALALLNQAQHVDPASPMIAFRRADVHFHLGQYENALAIYTQLLAHLPQSPDLLHNRAFALKRLNRLDEALSMCSAAIALAPRRADLYFMRGTILQSQGTLEAALTDYLQALTYDAAHTESLNAKASVLHDLGYLEDALEASKAALALQPHSGEALGNYGSCLATLDRLDEALAAYDEALRLAPHGYALRNNHSNMLFRLGKYDQALAGYDTAIALEPSAPEAYCGKGTVLYATAHYIQAAVCFNKALALAPRFPLAEFNKAMHRLLIGDFEEGWPLYEARWYKPGHHAQRGFTQPLWLGIESLAGKTILLHAEQGLGDTLQFCRYAPLFEARGAKVILEVQPSLAELMHSVPGNHSIVVKGQALPDFDFHCPLMSLPLAMNTRLDNIPNTVPYLSPNAANIADWRHYLGPERRLRVGIAWSGSKKHAYDHQRSIPLAQLKPFMDCDAEFHAIQNEVRASDAACLAESPLRFHGERLKTMDDTAALLGTLDLVISVDTSLVHLAGALGKPTWVMLPYVPDFRWLLNRTDSPWYPTVNLFRQSHVDQWDPVISSVRDALQTLISSRG